MAIENGYLTVDELRDRTRDQQTAYVEEYETAIEAASRQIDDYCGRVFYADQTATAVLYRTNRADLVWTKDFWTGTGLIVETDDDNDGTFETTWDAADYQIEPFERKNKSPYYRISAVGSKSFPIPPDAFGQPGRRALIRVTAKWGWEEIPANIRQATAIQAIDNFKSKDLTHVAATYGNEVRVARDYSPGSFGRKVRFTRTRAPLLNPQAEALISSLRKTVIA